jgi:hypothetical protein
MAEGKFDQMASGDAARRLALFLGSFVAIFFVLVKCAETREAVPRYLAGASR